MSKKQTSYQGITREDIEREWVTKDKQTIISQALKLFDACDDVQMSYLKLFREKEELADLHTRLQKKYRELMESLKTRKGRRSLSRLAKKSHVKDPLLK